MYSDESQLDLPVRPGDLDALGHVNHAVALAYLEAGRRHWLESRAPVTGTEAVAVVSRAEVDYRAELPYGPLAVRTLLTSPSAADLAAGDITYRAVFRQRIFPGRATAPAVEALITVAFLDTRLRHLIPLHAYLAAVHPAQEQPSPPPVPEKESP